MDERESEAEFQHHLQLLVERGLARATLYDSRRRIAEFAWTPEGETLHRGLRQLFALPAGRAAAPADLTPQTIISLVTLLLFTTPSEPPGE